MELKVNVFTIAVVLMLIASLSFPLNTAKAYSNTFAISVTVSCNAYTSQIIFGLNPSAPNSYSSTYDTPAPPAPPAGVNSYLYYPNYSPSYYQQLSQSIIPDSGNDQWTLIVQSIDQTGTMTLTWNGTSESPMTLENSAGTTIANMNSENTYSYSVSSGQSSTFYIMVSSISTTSTPSITPSPTPTSKPMLTPTPSPTPIPVATANSTATTSNNSATVNQTATTGVSVTVSGSSLPNGAQVIVTSTNYGSSPPSGTGNVTISGAVFYDVKVTSSSGALGSDVSSTISITNPSFTDSSVIEYWNGNSWVSVATTFTTPDTVSGTIPASELTGTLLAVGIPKTIPEYSEQLLGITLLASTASATISVVITRRRKQPYNQKK